MKKTAIVVLIILLATAGSLYYLWRRATLLPEWYTVSGGGSGRTVIAYGKGMEDIRRSLERTVQDQLQKPSTRSRPVVIVLGENDANKLFAAIISDNAGTYPYLNAVKASRTRIRDGSLDFGVVVDASEMVRGAQGQGVEGALPGLLRGRELSLAFTGKYGLKDGRVQLDEEGKVRIGALSFSLKTITNRLGISEDQLKKTLNEIELGKLKIDSIEPIRNTLLLKGSLPPS